MKNNNNNNNNNPILAKYAFSILEEKENPKSSLIIIPDSISSKKRKGCGMYNGGILELPKKTICHFKEEFRSYYRFPDGKERMILNSELIYGYE